MYLQVLGIVFNGIREIEKERGREYHIYPGRLSSRAYSGNDDYWTVSHRLMYWDGEKTRVVNNLRGLRQVANEIFKVGWMNVVAVEVNIEHFARVCGDFSSPHTAASHRHIRNLGHIKGPLSDKYMAR